MQSIQNSLVNGQFILVKKEKEKSLIYIFCFRPQNNWAALANGFAYICELPIKPI